MDSNGAAHLPSRPADRAADLPGQKTARPIPQSDRHPGHVDFAYELRASWRLEGRCAWSMPARASRRNLANFYQCARCRHEIVPVLNKSTCARNRSVQQQSSRDRHRSSTRDDLGQTGLAATRYWKHRAPAARRPKGDRDASLEGAVGRHSRDDIYLACGVLVRSATAFIEKGHASGTLAPHSRL